MIVPVIVFVVLPAAVFADPIRRNLKFQGDVYQDGIADDENDTFCQIIASDILSECNCTDKKLGGVVNCSVSLLQSDQIGLILDIAPCDDVAHLDLTVTERTHGINYTLAGIEVGETLSEPIPGLSIDVPKVGNAGVVAIVSIEGGLDMLDLKIGLNACAEILGEKVCGSSLTSYLPFWILDDVFHFSNFCEQALSESMLYV